MSWQAYVDDHLMCEIEGNHLSSAAIIGHDGSIWAQSSSFPSVKPEEITAIINDFNEPGSLAPTGLYLGGTKYMVIQGEAGAVIRGKKGPGGVTVKKTTMSLIIGVVFNCSLGSDTILVIKVVQRCPGVVSQVVCA
ncbi:unnamed protein product [Lactuca virosa]|uniref:Profilin n=1 Tax=Lactuca virosa TaxID=75947 RepID=A0AAU9MG99_9ASTR|nr:unnamed protein product [Lactuca virosa]